MRSGNWEMYNYRWVFEWMNAHGYPIQLISFKDWKERYYYLPSEFQMQYPRFKGFASNCESIKSLTLNYFHNSRLFTSVGKKIKAGF